MIAENNRTALIAGATGLTGGLLLPLLVKESAYSRIIALTRKPLPSNGDKIQNIVIDFDQLPTLNLDQQVDDVFILFGSTIKQAGSKDAFYRIDHDYIVNVARLARNAGATRCFLMSSMGANSSSFIFYTRVKGEMERDISRQNWPALHIFRPGMLLGDRKEKRVGEKIGQALASLMIGPLKKYSGIKAQTVAQAMLAASRFGGSTSLKIYDDEAMRNLPGVINP